MLTKETTPEIRELYREVMLKFNSERIHEVFSSEVTMVIDRKPDCLKYDIWFYRFKEGPDRVAQITNGGEYMVLDSGLREDMVLNCMRGLPNAIQDSIDWLHAAKAERAEGRRPRTNSYLRRS